MLKVTVTLTLKDQRLNPATLDREICNCLHQSFRGDQDNMSSSSNEKTREELRATGKVVKRLNADQAKRFINNFLYNGSMQHFNVFIE